MKKFNVTNIIWDADDEEDIQNLPTTMEVVCDEDLTDDEDIEDFISDEITDQTGFCHKGFDWDEME